MRRVLGTLRRAPSAAAMATATLALSLVGCPGHPPDLLDFCDGDDDDGDGRIDEGTGAQIGCSAGQSCVGGECWATCGDHICVADDETCASCPDDCGACPRCGDGTCDLTETCSICADDCGACPGCGDGECNAGEGCADCPGDCGRCPGECQPCGSGCPAPLECGQRICDGALGCYVNDDSSCERIGTAECNGSYAWASCVTDDDCPTLLECSDYLTGARRCIVPTTHGSGTTCPASVRCPPAPSSPAGLSVECVAFPSEFPSQYDYDCYLRCSSTCPDGMTCTGGRCRDAGA